MQQAGIDGAALQKVRLSGYPGFHQKSQDAIAIATVVNTVQKLPDASVFYHV